MRSLKPEVTEGPRSDILRVVAEVPGIHLRRIERTTSLPLGQVLYHLDRLERMGIVSSLRDHGFRRYYVTHDIGRPQKRILAALRHETPRRIVLDLLERPGQTHKELLSRVDVAGSTLSFHLQRLVEAEVLVRRDDAPGGVRYEVAQADVAFETLAEHRRSFDDPAVDDFVETRSIVPS